MIERLRGTLVASDPNKQRLRLAVRGVLALALAAVGVWLLSRALGKSVLAGAPAVIVAMTGSIAINGPSRGWRVATIGLGAVTAIGGASLAAWLAPSTLTSRVVFVALAGVAVGAQVFGQRGMAAGMLGFMAYFISLFLHVPLATLWWTAIAIGAGAVVVAVVQIAVPEPSASDLTPFVRAFRARARALERAAAARTSATRRRLRQRVVDLRETSLAFDDRLREDDGDLRDVLLDATLAAERVAELAWQGREDDGARRRLHELEQDLERCARERRGEGSLGGGFTAPEKPVVARKVLQAVVATAVAVPLGELVSTQRWYWAALGAFVVFTRPETAGETVTRAAERLVGTTAGAAAGIALGSAVSGSKPAQIVVLAVALFVTLYAFPLSYALAMAGVTTVLAILYDLLGTFSDELLGIRVAETAIGVTLGGLAALTIFPTSTRGKIERAERELLGDVRGFVEALRTRSDASAPARALERDAQTLRSAAQPIARPLPGLGSARERRRVALLGSLGRSARATASALRQDGLDDERFACVQQELDAIERALETPSVASDEAPAETDGNGPAIESLRRMRRTLAALADDELGRR